MIYKSTITCPSCGAEHEEKMNEYVAVGLYTCQACHARIRTPGGQCCVFCAFGSVPCPHAQIQGGACCDGD